MTKDSQANGQILGLGGVFYKVSDPKAYCGWWETHMGLNPTDWGNFEWEPDGKGRVMMSPFANDTEYLAPSTKGFMINLRVSGIAALIERARAGGAQIVGTVENTEYGIFGWFIDPEGIKIELWEEV